MNVVVHLHLTPVGKRWRPSLHENELGSTIMTEVFTRRQTLVGIGTAVALPLSTTSVQATNGALSDAEIDEFESKIRSLFGTDNPIPAGLEDEANDTESEDDPLSRLEAFVDGDEETDTASDGTTETVVTTTVDVAQAIDAQFDPIENIGDAAEQVANIEGEFTRQTFRAQHILAVLTEQQLVQSLTPKDIVGVRETVPNALRFLPLIGSANNVITTAAEVTKEDSEALVEFYVAVAAFCVEVLFFQFGVGYKVAFRGTNLLATRTTFGRLLQYTSPKTYGLILSEVHWALREGVSKGAGVVISNTFVFAHEQTQSLNEEDLLGKVDGAPDEIDISREDLADAICDLGSQHETSWTDQLLGRQSDELDAIVERSETIVQGACRT